MQIEASTRVESRKLLWLLFVSYFTFGIVLNVVGVIIPVLIKQYNLSLFVGGLLAFAFYISFGVCSVPAGVLADRIGPRPVVLSGVFLMGAGCLAMPWARNFATIALLAFFIGAGVALLQTAGNPLIERLDRPENYHRNLTLTIGFCGIGAFTGPFCLSALQSHGQPWQRLYLGFAVLCGTLLLLLFLAKFPERDKFAQVRIQFSEIGKLLGHPIAITYTLAIFFYVGAEVGTASWIVKFFEQIHGIGPIGTSGSLLSFKLPALSVLTVSLFWGLQGAGRLISGPLITKLGPRSTLQLYSLAALGSLFLATFASTNITAVGFAACGFFTSVLFTLLFSGAIHTFSHSQGAISGLLITASIGGAFIPPLVGLTADHFGLQVGMMVPALCFLYVLLVSFVGKARYE
ncbi:MAG: sugar MFS transporter [Terriglobales bacterium]